MKKFVERKFALDQRGSSVKTEVLAGIIGFFTVFYIIVVNSSILAEAGVPAQGAALATIFITVFGCLVMGFYANVPLILMPGMGINALFAYTLVGNMGLSWQEALASCAISGLLFMILCFTPFATKLNQAIPLILKQGITVGLGLFLVLLGLEKGAVIMRGEHAVLQLGSMHDPYVISTLITLLLTMILVIRKVPGAFLWSLLAGSLIGYAFGIRSTSAVSGISLKPISTVFGHLDFSHIGNVSFWSAVFTMTMVIVFETVGLTNGQTRQLKQEQALPRVLRASSITVFFSGIFGTSPTVSALESGSMFASGAKTGLATIVTAICFLGSLFFMPFLGFIPSSAIAPILIAIGISMVQELKEMDFSDSAGTFAAFLIVVIIPFSYSIVDGIAIGFIAYPLLRIFTKKAEALSPIMYIIAALFLLQFIIQ